MFVLALTSNAEGPRCSTPAGRTAGRWPQAVLDAAAAENAGAVPMGGVGVVVGATVTGDGRTHDLQGSTDRSSRPGFGAQGGTAADLAAVFGGALPRVLASTSREVLGAGPAPSGLRDAAARALDAVAAVVR